jgi:hypothetical protein
VRAPCAHQEKHRDPRHHETDRAPDPDLVVGRRGQALLAALFLHVEKKPVLEGLRGSEGEAVQREARQHRRESLGVEQPGQD